MTIGFIGNFTVPYTTEHDRKWSLEKLGHTVTPFQENRTTARQLLNERGRLDLLLYSHTHDPSWGIKDLSSVFEAYAQAGIPTASCHLDRWANLERESDVGVEATWHVKHLFMADGSPEMRHLWRMTGRQFKGQKYHWLKPGVVERDCYLAKPNRSRFPHDIIFVGSKGYHPEHPHRPQLIEWLAEVYGSRFGHYGNDGLGTIRGKDLNTLYASAKIVVGDSCFAGRTKDYWSDRIPETTGRGGFLLHPTVEGLDHEGVPTWEAGDYLALRELVDYFLDQKEAREEVRLRAHHWTKNNATYTHRSDEMLEAMGL